MRCCRSDWPGLCLFCCYQPLCVVSQQSWFGFFYFINFPILLPSTPTPNISDLKLSPPPPAIDTERLTRVSPSSPLLTLLTRAMIGRKTKYRQLESRARRLGGCWPFSGFSQWGGIFAVKQYKVTKVIFYSHNLNKLICAITGPFSDPRVL